MQLLAMVHYFERVLKGAARDPDILNRTYTSDRLAKVLGVLKTRAKQRLYEMEKAGSAIPAGNDSYRFTVPGLVELSIEEVKNEKDRLDRLMEKIIREAPKLNRFIENKLKELEETPMPQKSVYLDPIDPWDHRLRPTELNYALRRPKKRGR